MDFVGNEKAANRFKGAVPPDWNPAEKRAAGRKQ